MSMSIAKPALDLADAYRRDGFVVVRNLFPAAMRDIVLREIVTTFHARAKALGLDLPKSPDQGAFSDLAAGLFQHDIPSYIAAAKLSQHLASLHSMGLCAELMDVVAQLGLTLPAVSTRPVIHFMCDRLKIPGGYQKSPVHQDWRSVQGSLDGLTIWSPLYDVGFDDHPLEVIRGSHRRGLLPNEEALPNYRVLEPHYDEADFETLPLRAGDAVLFSGFLVHRTGERGCDRVRVACSFRFNNVLEPTFVERNYPNPYIYRPDHTMLTTDFPGPDDVEAIFS